MHILVIGASGGIGLQVVKQALARGHSVRGMARSAGSIAIDDPAFEPFAGDARDPEAVAAALDRIDAVAVTLGVRLRARTVLNRIDLFSGTTAVLLPAMEAAGVRRLVAVTGFGAGDSRPRISRLESVPFRLALGRAYADKDRQEALITASGLDWTLVRPGILTSGAATGRYRVLDRPESWHNGLIPRADVADFIVLAIETGSFIRRAPILVL